MTLLRALFLAGCFSTFALGAVPPASAQQARAYAPENLRTLSVSDRTRVIRQEYAEQARGRQLPDDQLRFYLDQDLQPDQGRHRHLARRQWRLAATDT